MSDTPSPEDVLQVSLRQCIGYAAYHNLGANIVSHLRERGYEIVRSEDRRDEAIVREVLSGAVTVTTGRANVGQNYCRVADGDLDRNGRGLTPWAALVAACREAQQDATRREGER